MELKPQKTELLSLGKVGPAKPISLRRRLHQAGQGMAEYILIIGLVALVVFGLVKTFGTDISNLFNNANTDLQDANK